MAEEAAQKVQQLQLVFSKAMDVTFENLGPDDLKKCFGELRSEFGNSLDGKLVQQLALSKNRLQGEFEALCDKYQLTEELTKISDNNNEGDSNIHRDSGTAIQSTQIALKDLEIAEMRRLVEELEKENSQLLESRRLMSKKIADQIAVVEDEESKMKAAVDQL